MTPMTRAFPDSHEHSQIQAEIRACKAGLHWSLEVEWMWRVAEDPSLAYRNQWGLYECFWGTSEALKQIKQKSAGRVPL